MELSVVPKPFAQSSTRGSTADRISLRKNAYTGEVQVSSVSVDTVDKAVDITEVVKDSSVDNVDNVDETSDSSRLYRNRLYQVSHHQRIL